MQWKKMQWKKMQREVCKLKNAMKKDVKKSVQTKKCNEKDAKIIF